MEAAFVTRMVALSLVLLVVGSFGVLWRRNLLVALMSLQLMMAAGQLAFVAFGRASGAGAATTGPAFAVVALVVAVTQLVVGLATVAAAVRNRDSVDVEDVRSMRG